EPTNDAFGGVALPILIGAAAFGFGKRKNHKENPKIKDSPVVEETKKRLKQLLKEKISTLDSDIDSLIQTLMESGERKLTEQLGEAKTPEEEEKRKLMTLKNIAIRLKNGGNAQLDLTKEPGLWETEKEIMEEEGWFAKNKEMSLKDSLRIKNEAIRRFKQAVIDSEEPVGKAEFFKDQVIFEESNKKGSHAIIDLYENRRITGLRIAMVDYLEYDLLTMLGDLRMQNGTLMITGFYTNYEGENEVFDGSLEEFFGKFERLVLYVDNVDQEFLLGAGYTLVSEEELSQLKLSKGTSGSIITNPDMAELHRKIEKIEAKVGEANAKAGEANAKAGEVDKRIDRETVKKRDLPTGRVHCFDSLTEDVFTEETVREEYKGEIKASDSRISSLMGIHNAKIISLNLGLGNILNAFAVDQDSLRELVNQGKTISVIEILENGEGHYVNVIGVKDGFVEVTDIVSTDGKIKDYANEEEIKIGKVQFKNLETINGNIVVIAREKDRDAFNKDEELSRKELDSLNRKVHSTSPDAANAEARTSDSTMKSIANKEANGNTDSDSTGTTGTGMSGFVAGGLMMGTSFGAGSMGNIDNGFNGLSSFGEIVNSLNNAVNGVNGLAGLAAVAVIAAIMFAASRNNGAGAIAPSPAAPRKDTGKTISTGDLNSTSINGSNANARSPPQTISELAKALRNLANQSSNTKLGNLLNNAAENLENLTEAEQVAIDFNRIARLFKLLEKAFRREDEDYGIILLNKLLSIISMRGLKNLDRNVRYARYIAHMMGLPFSYVSMKINDIIDTLKGEKAVKYEMEAKVKKLVKNIKGKIASSSLTTFGTPRKDTGVAAYRNDVSDRLLERIFDTLTSASEYISGVGGVAINAIRIGLGAVRAGLNSTLSGLATFLTGLPSLFAQLFGIGNPGETASAKAPAGLPVVSAETDSTKVASQTGVRGLIAGLKELFNVSRAKV
ncbi:MAG: hypothetical protein COV71_01795, partial [Candidatus Omnitrophica bacterium CG11_big_fil_rev_8_21_14_0_20_41_12]